MLKHKQRALLPSAAALLCALGVVVPLTAAPAHAMQVGATAMTVRQAEQIAQKETYIPQGYTFSSSNFSAAQGGQPAQYNLNYTSSPTSFSQETYLNVTVDASNGVILSYYRQPTSVLFHFPAQLSLDQAQTLAEQWVQRLYGPYTKELMPPQVLPSGTSLTVPITYTFSFERIVNGVPAPFNGVTIGLSSNGHLTQASATWATVPFPSAKPVVSVVRAKAIYQKSLHFYLVYGQQYNQGGVPSTVLAYTQPALPYSDAWSTSLPDDESVIPPVISATSGQVINSKGVVQPLPSHEKPSVIQPGGPAIFPGKPRSDWTETEALTYATRLLNLAHTDVLSSASISMQQTPNDKVWNFTWNAPGHRQILASVDATQGVLSSYNDIILSQSPPAKSQGGQTVPQKDLKIAEAFIRHVFPQDTGGISVSLAPFQKFPGGQRPFYTVRFSYRGLNVQTAEGYLNVDGATGQVASFNWQPIVGLATLQNPSKAVPVGQVTAAWMKADPLSLQYLSTQSGHIVLVYAPIGQYGNGMMINALTGSPQTQGLTPQPYTGKIRDLAGTPNAAEVQLLASEGLLPVSASGDVYPHQVLTQAALVTMVMNALELSSTPNVPPSELNTLKTLLTSLSPSSPDYTAISSAFARGWLGGSPAFSANAPASREFAAQFLARALGYGPVLGDPQSFHLAAQDAATIPTSDYAADALAVALHMLSLRGGNFDAAAGLTVAQAAQAVVAMANAYAVGALSTQQPGGMGAMG
ncbi:MAG: hypothetical protein OWT28_05935 [Firmicutes bacterium]|nr:hypothetical protein [Bacillota bacterium]